jgi:hypothetical protein
MVKLVKLQKIAKSTLHLRVPSVTPPIHLSRLRPPMHLSRIKPPTHCRKLKPTIQLRQGNRKHKRDIYYVKELIGHKPSSKENGWYFIETRWDRYPPQQTTWESLKT